MKNFIEEIRKENTDYEIKNNRKRTYHIETYGCQMNLNDSEKLAGLLSEMYFSQADKMELSDFIIFNTCCVREHAEQKVFGNVGALKRKKAKKPELLIAVCGCMMQQEGMAETMMKKFPFVDMIFGTHNLHCFTEYVYEALCEKHKIQEIFEEQQGIYENIPTKRNRILSSFVSIMYGCNNFCSYCVVPYVRGRERSREVKDILDEIKGLEANGCKEIMLLGQNVNSYGATLSPVISFPQLLSIITEKTNIERIRFMTSHPKDLTDELIDIISSNEKICNHLHLPIQSGSNAILKAMNRKYTREYYLDIVNRLRKKTPDITITTDIIVGFPGETEEQFNETVSLLKEVMFDGAFMFMYSPRDLTSAAKMPNQIDLVEKKRRLQILMKTQAECGNRVNQKYIGKIEEVLVESHETGKRSGRTGGNKLVKIEGDGPLDDVVKVEIISSSAFSLRGKILE
jgi:tRNA-2-methylthio-N6-dimethylallyladenosine synthase